MPNPIVHFEIIVKDQQRGQTFYDDVFGWKINADNPMNYGIVSKQDDTGIGGGVTVNPETPNAIGTTIYIQVKEIDPILKKIESKGGKIVMPRTVIPGAVTMAQFTDPDGNMIGLVEEGIPSQ